MTLKEFLRQLRCRLRTGHANSRQVTTHGWIRECRDCGAHFLDWSRW